MNDADTLTYRDAVVDWPLIRFGYEAAGQRHEIGLVLDGIDAPNAGVDPTGIEHLAAWIGLSYAYDLFQLRDFDRVVIEPLVMREVTRSALERSFRRQLTEWRYVNGLDIHKPVAVECEEGAVPPMAAAPTGRILLLNGGGKDTAVAAETLAAIDRPFTWLTANRAGGPTAAQVGLMEAFGPAPRIHADKRIDRSSLTRQGRHTSPTLVRLGNLSYLLAYAGGFEYIVLANEQSANFGNLVVDGVEINHQEGKSLVAERRISSFAERRLVTGIRRFSLVAPLYELQITRLFAELDAYHRCFVSCNIGHRRNFWCKSCPKCAFIYLALAAWLEPSELVPIFGEEFFARDTIRRWVVRLTTPGPKPLECVGTKDESRVALGRVLARRAWREALSPALARTFRYCLRDTDLAAAEASILGTVDRPHGLPPDFEEPVMRHFRRALGLA